MEVIVRPTQEKQTLMTENVRQRIGKLTNLPATIKLIRYCFTFYIAFAYVVTILAILVLPATDRAIGLVLFVGLQLVLLWLLRHSQRELARALYDPNMYSNAPARYVIENDAFVIYKRGSTERILWGEFKEVERTPKLIVVYADTLAAFYIGYDDFANAQDFQAFYEAIKARIAASRPAKAP